MGIYALTGGATGIGAELKRQLAQAGHEVISVDIREGDIIADLATREGRQAAVDGIRERAPWRPRWLHSLRRLAAGGQTPVADPAGQLFRGGRDGGGPARPVGYEARHGAAGGFQFRPHDRQRGSLRAGLPGGRRVRCLQRYREP